jgi:nicotinate-nucleotide adenylyltransferase
VAELIGVYGGTFDPIHVGHVAAAGAVLRTLGLDRVLLVPAGDPWQKRGRVVATPEQRLEMARLAVEGLDGVEVSDLEVRRGVASVTADTLEDLRAPERELFLILGADAVANMGTWRRLDDTRDLATIVVVERDGERADPPGEGWRVEHVPIPRIDVSSTEIRDLIAAGESIDGLVPPTAARYLQEHGIYTSRR